MDEAFFKKEIAHIPVWVWLVGLGGGVAVGLWLRHRSATQNTTDNTTDAASVTPSDPIDTTDDGTFFPATGAASGYQTSDTSNPDSGTVLPTDDGVPAGGDTTPPPSIDAPDSDPANTPADSTPTNPQHVKGTTAKHPQSTRHKNTTQHKQKAHKPGGGAPSAPHPATRQHNPAKPPAKRTPVKAAGANQHPEHTSTVHKAPHGVPATKAHSVSPAHPGGTGNGAGHKVTIPAGPGGPIVHGNITGGSPPAASVAHHAAPPAVPHPAAKPAGSVGPITAPKKPTVKAAPAPPPAPARPAPAPPPRPAPAPPPPRSSAPPPKPAPKKK